MWRRLGALLTACLALVWGGMFVEDVWTRLDEWLPSDVLYFYSDYVMPPPCAPAPLLAAAHAMVNTTANATAARPGSFAFVTLLTHSIDSKRELGYAWQACSLGLQLRDMYPDTPRLALHIEGRLSPGILRALAASGWTPWPRPEIEPGYTRLNHDMYKHQFMKFWCWTLLEYEWVVYIDADTFFTGDVGFPGLIAQTAASGKPVMACPLWWSQAYADGTPTTWNGALFIVRPSLAMFNRLLGSCERPTHFTTRYSTFNWFDNTEMGTFMREFPEFAMPRDLHAVCSETTDCCYKPSCYPANLGPLFRAARDATNATRGRMVHSIKKHDLKRDAASMLGIPTFFGKDPPEQDTHCLWRKFTVPYSRLLLRVDTSPLLDPD